MSYFVSYELVRPDGVTVDQSCCVVTNSAPSEIQTDMDAIRNDSGKPDHRLRVLCLTILPDEPAN